MHEGRLLAVAAASTALAHPCIGLARPRSPIALSATKHLALTTPASWDRKGGISFEGREVAVFWDLDNVGAGNNYALLIVLHRLQAFFTELGLTPDHITLYCNKVTMARLQGPDLTQLLRVLNASLKVCDVRPNAADGLMIADAFFFGTRKRGAGAVVFVSRDTGFSTTLTYLTDIGVATLLVAPFRRHRNRQDIPPQLHKEKLALGCCVVAVWSPSRAPITETERRFVHSVCEKADVVCEQSFAKVEAVQGEVTYVWFNGSFCTE